MRRAVFVDTVGLIAAWDRDDKWHDAASHACAALIAGHVELYSTSYVLLECGNTAVRKPFRRDVDVLRNLLESRGVLIHPALGDWDAAWRAYVRGEHANAGIVDQVSFVVMRRIGLTRAFTNDRHFRAAGFEPIF